MYGLGFKLGPWGLGLRGLGLGTRWKPQRFIWGNKTWERSV